MEEIEYIDYGIACRIGNTIYLNKKLLDYPILCKAILKHEHEHSPLKRYTLKDLKLDIKGKYFNSVKGQYYKFILKNPKTLVQFLPIGFYKGRLVIDPMMLILWIMIVIFVWGILGGALL